jgi:uncharacterized FlaG/YvyC family protein
MGYAIGAGAGLAIGIGFLIWALVERSKRAAAESSAQKAQLKILELSRSADNNREVAEAAQQQTKRVEEQLALMRSCLDEARKRLAQCGDPQAIRSWLDENLKGEVL